MRPGVDHRQAVNALQTGSAGCRVTNRMVRFATYGLPQDLKLPEKPLPIDATSDSDEFLTVGFVANGRKISEEAAIERQLLIETHH
jgi:hypothetical protein